MADKNGAKKPGSGKKDLLKSEEHQRSGSFHDLHCEDKKPDCSDCTSPVCPFHE